MEVGLSFRRYPLRPVVLDENLRRATTRLFGLNGVDLEGQFESVQAESQKRSRGYSGRARWRAILEAGPRLVSRYRLDGTDDMIVA